MNTTPDVIERYEIPVDDQTHTFTIGRGPLHFAYYTPRSVEFWAYTPTDSSANDREFTVIGTGHPLPAGTWHVGTVISPSGNVVWHVLERGIPIQPQAEVSVEVQPTGDTGAPGREVGRIVRRARRGGLEGDA